MGVGWGVGHVFEVFSARRRVQRAVSISHTEVSCVCLVDLRVIYWGPWLSSPHPLLHSCPGLDFSLVLASPMALLGIPFFGQFVLLRLYSVFSLLCSYSELGWFHGEYAFLNLLSPSPHLALSCPRLASSSIYLHFTSSLYLTLASPFLDFSLTSVCPLLVSPPYPLLIISSPFPYPDFILSSSLLTLSSSHLLSSPFSSSFPTRVMDMQ